MILNSMKRWKKWLGLSIFLLSMIAGLLCFIPAVQGILTGGFWIPYSGRWAQLKNVVFWQQFGMFLFFFPLILLIFRIICKVELPIQKKIMILALLLAVTVLLNLDSGHCWSGDYPAYIRQAECIVNGSFEPFMSENIFEMQHSDVLLGPYAYPWGVPILLSGLVAGFGRNFFCMKLMNLAALILLLFCIYNLFRERLGDRELFFLLIWLFLPDILLHANLIGSELSFTAFSMLSILVMDRYLKADRKRKLLLAILMGFCCGFSSIIRVNGVCLMAAWVVLQFFQRIRKENGICIIDWLPLLSFICFMVGIKLVFPDGEASHWQLFIRNFSIAHFFRQIGWYSFTVWLKFFHDNFLLPVSCIIPLWLAAIFCLVNGLWQRCKTLNSFEMLLLIFTGGTFFSFWLWQVSDIRFTFVIQPFLYYWILSGLHGLNVNHSKLQHGLLFLLCLLMLIGSSLIVFRIIRLHTTGNPLEILHAKSTCDLFDFIRTKVPEKSVVIFFKPRLMTMFTKRISINVYKPEHFEWGDYYCWTDDPQDFSLPFQVKFKDRLELCFQEGPFRMYRIHKEHDRNSKSIDKNELQK